MERVKGNRTNFPLPLVLLTEDFPRYGFARYENTDEAEDCIRGLVSSKYEAGFARVPHLPELFALVVY